jgi:hypothetical protein
MAKRTLTLTFPNPLNISVQVNDVVYWSDSGTVVEIGKILTIVDKVITCEMENNQENPDAGAFILFSKDNRKNLTSITGYYAEVEMKNDSQEYAEIFSVGSEVFESSK